jgi:hypothetical protein
MWRCPHCGTPQAETARCWVCRRSSTTCSTCRHFRRSLALNVGYCGLDRRRLPLTGAELRGCWAAAAPVPLADPLPPGEANADPGVRLRGFVPVETIRLSATSAAAPIRLQGEGSYPVVPPLVLEPPTRPPDGTTLFGDLET